MQDVLHDVLEVPTVLGSIRYEREESTFVNPFSREQVEAIIESSRVSGRVAEDETGIRLNDVRSAEDGTVLALSTVSFADFLATNMLPLIGPVTDRWMEAKTHRWRMHGSYQQVLADVSLSNLMAISLLIADDEGKIGVAQRSERVAVDPGSIGATVTGTPNLEDYDAADPLMSCVLREAREELNLEGLKNVAFGGLMIGRQKLQPVALYSARVDGRWENLAESIRRAVDYELETERLLAMSHGQLLDSMENLGYTSVARYQIAKHLGLV